MDAQLGLLIELVAKINGELSDLAAVKYGAEAGLSIGPITIMVGSTFISGSITSEQNYLASVRRNLEENGNGDGIEVIKAAFRDGTLPANDSTSMVLRLLDVNFFTIPPRKTPHLAVRIANIQAWFPGKWD